MATFYILLNDGTSRILLNDGTSKLRLNDILIPDAGSYTLTGTDQTLLYNRKLVPTAGSYSLTGTAATPEYGRKIVAGTTTYSLTGSHVGLIWSHLAGYRSLLRINAGTGSHIFPLGIGSYSLTGSTVSLLRGYKPTAGQGSYFLTGTSASLNYGYKIVAGVGTYSLTGSDAVLNYAPTTGSGFRSLLWRTAGKAPTVFALGSSSYSLTGSTATLRHNWKIVADNGSYFLSGSTVTLTYTPSTSLPGFRSMFRWIGGVQRAYGYKSLFWRLGSVTQGFTVAPGTYNLTPATDAGIFDPGIFDSGIYDTGGQPSTKLLYGRLAGAAAGNYSLTGTDAALKLGRKVVIGGSSYSLTGADVNLFKTGVPKVLFPDAGTYSLSGTSASLNLARLIVPDAGTYLLTGSTVSLEHDYILVSESGFYSHVGTPAGLLYSNQNRSLAPDSGSYLLTGRPVGLIGGHLTGSKGFAGWSSPPEKISRKKEIAAKLAREKKLRRLIERIYLGLPPEEVLTPEALSETVSPAVIARVTDLALHDKAIERLGFLESELAHLAELMVLEFHAEQLRIEEEAIVALLIS